MKSTIRLLPILLAAALVSSSPHELGAQTNKLTTTFDGITFDSAYDNGSLAAVSRNSLGDYDTTIFTESGESGTSKYWFRFTLSGVAGRTVTLHLDHSQNPVPFLRIMDPGPGAWRRLTATEAPDTGTITLVFSAGSYDVLVGNAAGAVNSLSATLAVLPAVNPNATPITAALDHNTLQIGWPADHIGWRLETQTNSLGVGLSTNWVTVPDSASTNSVFITVDPQLPAAFFRLVYP